MRAKMKPKARMKPTTVDEYLAAVSSDKRAALNKLRKTIHASIPKAEECISYGLPAFRLDGRLVLWFGAGANHCALYPGAVVEDFETELAGYVTSKGTIRFQPDDPLPATLVRKLLKARMARSGVRRTTSVAGGARRRERD